MRSKPIYPGVHLPAAGARKVALRKSGRIGYAISDGTDQPFRMKIHDPSFVHLQLVVQLMRGNLIADTMAVMASLDPIMGGVDK